MKEKSKLLLAALVSMTKNAKIYFESGHYQEAFAVYCQICIQLKSIAADNTDPIVTDFLRSSFQFASESACQLHDKPMMAAESACDLDSNEALKAIQSFYSNLPAELQNDSIITLFYAKVTIRLNQPNRTIKALEKVDLKCYNNNSHFLLEHGNILSTAYANSPAISKGNGTEKSGQLWESLKLLLSSQSMTEQNCIALIEIDNYLFNLYSESDPDKAICAFLNSYETIEKYKNTYTQLSELLLQAYLRNIYDLSNACKAQVFFIKIKKHLETVFGSSSFREAILSAPNVSKECILILWLSMAKSLLNENLIEAKRVVILVLSYLEKNHLSSALGSVVCFASLLMSRIYFRENPANIELMMAYCSLVNKHIDKVLNLETRSIISFKNKLHQAVAYGKLNNHTEQERIFESIYADLKSVSKELSEQYHSELDSVFQLLDISNPSADRIQIIKAHLTQKQIPGEFIDDLSTFIQAVRLSNINWMEFFQIPDDRPAINEANNDVEEELNFNFSTTLSFSKVQDSCKLSETTECIMRPITPHYTTY